MCGIRHFLKSLSINLATQADQLTRLLGFCHTPQSPSLNIQELLSNFVIKQFTVLGPKCSKSKLNYIK